LAKTRRSKLLKASRFGDFLRSTSMAQRGLVAAMLASRDFKGIRRK
jgi:hypothetical protein